MVKLIADGKEVQFSTTVFPDGTSQVWKVDRNAFGRDSNVEILWLFENEAELFHVCQLSQLLRTFEVSPLLNVPYLPYGRQDKQIDNGLSFALQTFLDVLESAGMYDIQTFDGHSYNQDIRSTPPHKFHNTICDHDVICFPDAGANERYKYNFDLDTYTQICFEKVRNQQTGEITGLKLLGSDDLNGRSILIVDDICDGGMTFIKVAQALKEYYPSRIDLAVSHGLFSKGKQCLYDAGIKNIYTTNSLLRNKEGFKVW